MSAKRETFLVLGGDTFVGLHVTKRLKARGDRVFVYDTTQRHDDGSVPYYVGDIRDKETLVKAIRDCGATCIIHTISPLSIKHDHEPEMFHAVNVTGTANVIAAATELGVKKLVYHSSGGVVFDKRDIKNGDESAPYVRKPWTPYLVSRVAADKAVLAANGQHGLMTAVIRPCGIFGDGDEERVKSVYLTWQRGTTHVQIGDNTNLVDCTYVGNVALALLLAADKLPSPDVAGEAFFVSNDAPLPFWTFMHMVWAKLDEELPEQSRAKRGLDKKKTVVIPYFVGLALAYAIQFFAWILRRPAPPMTPYTVVYTTASMYWSIDKARNVLGYKPDVSVEEGIARSVQWLKEEVVTTSTSS